MSSEELYSSFCRKVPQSSSSVDKCDNCKTTGSWRSDGMGILPTLDGNKWMTINGVGPPPHPSVGLWIRTGNVMDDVNLVRSAASWRSDVFAVVWPAALEPLIQTEPDLKVSLWTNMGRFVFWRPAGTLTPKLDPTGGSEAQTPKVCPRLFSCSFLKHQEKTEG